MNWFQKTDGILCDFQTKPSNILKFTHSYSQCCKNIREECGKGSKLLHSHVCQHIISFFTPPSPPKETIQSYLITAVHLFTRESLCEITHFLTLSHNTLWRNSYPKWPFPIACRHLPWGTSAAEVPQSTASTQHVIPMDWSTALPPHHHEEFL